MANELAAQGCRDSPALQAFYANTLAHVAAQKAAGGEVAAKYDSLQV